MTILVRSGVVAASRRYAMELVRPSSVAFSGTSADIVGLGSVDFSAVTELSLNGVFSAEYDNYMLVIRGTASTGANAQIRLRLSGTDNSTASSYVLQQLTASSTTVSGGRSTSNLAVFCPFNAVQRAGAVGFVYGPGLAQATAFRSVVANDADSARIQENAWTHNQATAYDGFTVFPGAGNLTGNIAVYGLRG